MPLAIDLFCGLGGWTDGLLAEGYDVTGYDIEEHAYGDMLLDIAEAGPRVWSPFPLADETDLDRLEELQAEAREMIERATGVTWDQISGACL